MTEFDVIPEELVNASASIDAGGASDGTLPAGALAGAAAATPIEGAWAAFLEKAIGASIALDQVSSELAAGLRVAGGNYQRTETGAADSFGGRR
ncbi:MAG TPA: hypothetical protein VMD09_12180 [Solirubrobacteraceae bacterium]|nr:hypothetical protein [Solirubrobacteraceae bacterium]